jgi:hypothetical protein
MVDVSDDEFEELLLACAYPRAFALVRKTLPGIISLEIFTWHPPSHISGLCSNDTLSERPLLITILKIISLSLPPT